MVLRVKPTPTRFPINSLYTPEENTPLHTFYTKNVPPVGGQLSYCDKSTILRSPSMDALT